MEESLLDIVPPETYIKNIDRGGYKRNYISAIYTNDPVVLADILARREVDPRSKK